MGVIRILVVDDQQLMRAALEHFIRQAGDLDVVGTAADGLEAIEAARTLSPDVVLMDMQMPRLNGVDSTRTITADLPGVKVLAITTFASEQFLVPALQAGASGYLVKDAPPLEVVEAVRRAHAGDAVFSPQVAKDLVRAIADSSLFDETRPAVTAPLHERERLTAREADVVVELANGQSNAEIARKLCLSEATVKTHLGKVMDKWGVRDRVQVLVRAARAGLVQFGQ